MTAFELADKVVLITGGLGSATARTLLSRGAQVGIVDLRPDTPEIAAGIRRPTSSALPRTSATAARSTMPWPTCVSGSGGLTS